MYLSAKTAYEASALTMEGLVACGDFTADEFALWKEAQLASLVDLKAAVLGGPAVSQATELS